MFGRWLVPLMLLTADTVAVAGPPSSEQARTTALRSRDKAFSLFRSGDPGGAIEAMRRAYEALPDPSFLYNIALFFENWDGHCAQTLEALDAYVDACRAASCNRLVDARKRRAGVSKACLAELAVTTSPEGAALELDGAYAGDAPLRTKLEPGLHTIVASLKGYVKTSARVELEADQREALTLTLRPEPVQGWVQLAGVPPGTTVTVDGRPVAKPTAPIALEPGPHRLEVLHEGRLRSFDSSVTARETTLLDLSSVLTDAPPAAAPGPRVWPWVSLASGIAGLIGGGVLLALERNEAAEFDDQNVLGGDRDALADTRARQQGYQVGAWVSGGVGIALGAVGIGLLATSVEEAGAPPTASVPAMTTVEP